MKINIYKIKSRLLIVFGTLVFLWIVFGIISITSVNKMNRFQQVDDEITMIEHGVEELAELKEILVNRNLDEQFYTTGETESTKNFQSIINKLQEQLEEVEQEDYFYYNDELSSVLLNTQAHLQEVQDNYQKLITALLTRGEAGSGLIADWNSQLQSINEINYQLNSFELSDGISTLQELLDSYQEYPETAPINRITEVSEGLKAISIEPDTTGMVPDAALASLQASLNSLTAISNEILEQDIMAGYINGGGFINSIDELLETINNDMDYIQTAMAGDFSNSRKRSKVALVVFWILFVAITVMAYLFLEKSLVTSFDRVKKYAFDFSKGIFPEKIKTSENDETGEVLKHFNDFTDSLKAKSEFARMLGEDKTDTKLQLLGENDTLGKSLLSLQDKLKLAKEEEEKRSVENEKRRWINEGLAKFGDILRQNNDNMEHLSGNLITNLVKYLNATQGGIFLLNDEDKNNVFLELKSAIAYNRQKFIERKVELGEGLVGTCAIERKSILLTEIPEEYLEITSGLGDANPRCLLIVPLNLEDETLGVIELASFNVFQDYEIEFVEKISESIASTLTAVKVNERTAELLAQSQKQAAEMSEQEEEMRQNMEELQATQEEAARRENEISSILNAIDATSLVVEYDMNGYITRINEKFLEILEIPKNDIIGIHHSNFTSKTRTENSYIEFWKELQNGKSITTVEVIKLLNGKKLWLNQNYSPIVNTDNQPYKIINIATDISETKLKEQSLEKRDREIARKTNEMELLNVAINEAIIKCDYSIDGNIISANENFAEVMGYSLQDLMGKNIGDLIGGEEKQAIDKIWSKLESNQAQKEVLKHVLPDGKEAFIMSSFTPVTDEEGKIYKIYYLGQDITEQKLKYNLLVEANKEIDRLKKLVGEE